MQGNTIEMVQAAAATALSRRARNAVPRFKTVTLVY